jgi:hypothetical protein
MFCCVFVVLCRFPSTSTTYGTQSTTTSRSPSTKVRSSSSHPSSSSCPTILSIRTTSTKWSLSTAQSNSLTWIAVLRLDCLFFLMGCEVYLAGLPCVSLPVQIEWYSLFVMLSSLKAILKWFWSFLLVLVFIGTTHALTLNKNWRRYVNRAF